MAKKAVSDFKKATNDPISILELMVYDVECGTQCTLDYGDIDEHFYYSLELMFDDILNILAKSHQEIIDMFLPRLMAVVQKAEGIGWGYYDYISDILEDYFQSERDLYDPRSDQDKYLIYCNKLANGFGPR
ncbi:MAG: hypothetical protein ACYS80_23395 [Planctomycetota bacterium]